MSLILKWMKVSFVAPSNIYW